ncbi:hypothetical protein M011DRAFT_20361 [Sporormia fimetaria CBS 119925]|uniref:Uncharacterized protein n=1 Tax=Sporormia fimetaria CBS 119925 TaxID=1340428 RepID=A0A6A6VRR6_9PLEO|nr:hypothetical protein M011DRAFT_20361 [Sporormia fimetaria CBS 119925]
MIRLFAIMYTRLIRSLSNVFAFPPSVVEASLPGGLTYLLILTINLLTVLYIDFEAWKQVPILFLYIASSAFLAGPLLVFLGYFIFRIAFKGSLSGYPRRLTGLEGTADEYVVWILPLLNLLYVGIGFVFEWKTEGMFKPPWAEYLG